MGFNDDLASWIDLSLVPGIGPQTYRALLSAFGLPNNIRSATRVQLAQVVPHSVAQRILENGREAQVAAAIAWGTQPGRSIITLADPDYPPRLLQISDPPVLLYVVGDIRLLGAVSLAVVGSRNSTQQGVLNAERFSRALSDAGLTIVSGLALGVDAAAHRGALDGRSSTIAVLGCGADIVYPVGNETLYRQIGEHGAIVSEFPLGTPPARRP